MNIYKPDFTAWFVLQGTLVAMHQPDFQSEENKKIIELYRPLAQAASKTRLISRLIYTLPYSWQYQIGELVTSPGRLRHYYLRKKEIEKQARKLLDDGAQQVIVLGSGLDVLSLRLAKDYPNVKFIEIDQEESQLFKQSVVMMHQIDIPENVELISGDLRDPLDEILKISDSYLPFAKTIWLAESFFLFFTPDQVDSVFRQIKALSSQNSCVLFTTLPKNEQGGAWAVFMQSFYLKKKKTPFQWTIPYEKVAEFAKQLGYETVFQLRCDLLHQSYMGPEFQINHDFAEDIHIAKIPNV